MTEKTALLFCDHHWFNFGLLLVTHRLSLVCDGKQIEALYLTISILYISIYMKSISYISIYMKWIPSHQTTIVTGLILNCIFTHKINKSQMVSSQSI